MIYLDTESSKDPEVLAKIKPLQDQLNEILTDCDRGLMQLNSEVLVRTFEGILDQIVKLRGVGVEAAKSGDKILENAAQQVINQATKSYSLALAHARINQINGHMGMVPIVEVATLRPWAQLPNKATDGAACYDIRFCPDEEPTGEESAYKLEINDRGIMKIPTGLAFKVPEGWEMQIRPRSGMAYAGTLIPNSPGTVDSDYTGEVFVLLRARPDFVLYPGFRIAQITFRRVPEVHLKAVDAIEAKTERGDGGFGSTGVE